MNARASDRVFPTRAPLFDSFGGRIVVVAMKTQLRGRIRRTVTTLLEQGAEVTVIALKSNSDFLLGLEHPNLEVELLEPSSLYVWLVNKQRSLADKRKHRWSRRYRPSFLIARNFWRPSRTHAHFFKREFSKLARLFKSRLFLVRTGADAIPAKESVGPDFVAAESNPYGAFQNSLKRAVRNSRFIKYLLEFDEVALSIHRVRLWVRRGKWRLRRRLRRVRLWVRRGKWRLRRRLRRVRLWVRRGKWRLRRRLRSNRRRRLLWLRRVFFPLHRVTRYLDFWRVARSKAREVNPALILSSDLPGLVPAALVAQRLRIAHVHDCHEFYLGSTNLRATETKFLEPVERRYMRRATQLIFVNESIRYEYRNRYKVDGVVVRNCADVSDSESGIDLSVVSQSRPGERIALYQGGFIPGRGLDVLIQAVSFFPEDTHLVMMGYGPLKEELHNLAVDLGVRRRISFLEAVPPSMLVRTTATATIGIIPYQPVSLNNKLALPNKIFEYTASGLPVVVAAIPELDRIARSGVGLSYDPFSPHELAEAVRTILDPTILSQTRRSVEEWAADNSWAVERHVLIDAWRSALRNQSESLSGKPKDFAVT